MDLSKIEAKGSVVCTNATHTYNNAPSLLLLFFREMRSLVLQTEFTDRLCGD